MKLRKANDRGHFQNNWLNSWHSFSFSSYYDPKHMDFSLLRVLNDDVIAPHQGFGQHPHKDMEIITFMLSGAIEHQDNLGNKHILEAGNVQLMRAGTGIRHSEMNPFDIPAHLLQIWIYSDQNDLEPGWWEKSFTEKSNTVLVEPTHKNESIEKLSSSLTGNGVKMAQQGYILAIHEETQLDFKNFGNSDVYIHLPQGNALIESKNDSWILNGGDALLNENHYENLILKPNLEPLLVFIFPK